MEWKTTAGQRMPYLIATDEAGLGPNLGPLVVSATVWELPEGMSPADLYGALGDSVVPSAAEADADRFAVADSKQLYKAGSAKNHLERGVLVALNSLQWKAETWRTLFDLLDPSSSRPRNSVPWYATYDEPIPFELPGEELAAPCRRFVEVTERRGVRLRDVRSRIVYPREFNDGLGKLGKGELLSQTTLGLAAELAGPLPGAVSVVCDKHGGRNRYADLLARHFPDSFIEIRGESRDLSVYAFGPPDRRMTVSFRTRAETILAVGLASMTSKYLRELSMRAFNRFWCESISGLRPTAGYPLDAKRFRKDIADKQKELRIADHILWRQK